MSFLVCSQYVLSISFPHGVFSWYGLVGVRRSKRDCVCLCVFQDLLFLDSLFFLVCLLVDCLLIAGCVWGCVDNCDREKEIECLCLCCACLLFYLLSISLLAAVCVSSYCVCLMIVISHTAAPEACPREDGRPQLGARQPGQFAQFPSHQPPQEAEEPGQAGVWAHLSWGV